MTIEEGFETMELLGEMDLSKLSVSESLTFLSAIMDFAKKTRKIVLKHTNNGKNLNPDEDLIKMLRKAKERENE